MNERPNDEQSLGAGWIGKLHQPLHRRRSVWRRRQLALSKWASTAASEDGIRSDADATSAWIEPTAIRGKWREAAVGMRAPDTSGM